MNNQKRFYSLKEVQEILNVTDRTLLRWRRQNIISEPLRIGRKVVGWPIADFENWLSNNYAMCQEVNN
ncbi:helix-turn-helix transcriptional regulator [Alteromonas sp. ASW11-130]|uniref:helix-turn-helix transcriptional regulator n=1 Tax=Alteromonas sp. ASW11-130 TaxID=3015775 RepID=UPI002242882C|nr:helix-turn-helix domain-containing protein [Alteromonas sp. ASW11-130]MCW8093397.1 helix-turn-helix domain-containing protein [Alteromonas sp. ASW11-130]